MRPLTLMMMLLGFCDLCTCADLKLLRSVGFGVNPPTVAKPGRHGDMDGSGSYLEFSNSETGGNIELALTQGDLESPYIAVEWVPDEPSWILLRFSGEGSWLPRATTRPTVVTQFNPLDVPHGFPIVGEYVIQPSPRGAPVFAIGLQARCAIHGGSCSDFGTYRLQYSVEVIPEPLPGDANVDGKVAFDDFVTLSNNYGDILQPWSRGDFNLDRKVDFEDFQIFANNYGTVRETPPAAVPEPASEILFSLGLLIGAVLRRARSW